MNRTLTIEYGDDLLAETGLSPVEFAKEAPFLLAAKLYEMGRLSSGQAARLCGRERAAFLAELARAGIPASNLTPEDAADELGFARGG